MEQDRYGLHTICTIYYDTEDFAIIRHSLDKPKFKEKLRLRSYGTPGETDTVYLELKKKLDGVTYKRRMSLPLWRSRDYLDYGIKPPEGTGQIFGEIDWFVGRYTVKLKDQYKEKELLDQIRQRNGNLNLTCGRLVTAAGEL